MRILFFIIFISLPSFAKTQKVLTLITSESPPFLSKELKEQGAAIYALNSILKDMDITIQIRFAPWRRAKIMAAEDSKLDGFFPYSAIDMKDEFIYSNFIYQAPWVLVQRKNHPIRWKKFKDLSKLTAGNVTGVELRPGIKELSEQNKIKVEDVLTDGVNLQRLGLERVDFVMMDYFVYRYTMLTDSNLDMYKNKFEINTKQIAISRYGLALRKTPENEDIMKRFNQRATPKIFHKYLEEYLNTFVRKK